MDQELNEIGSQFVTRIQSKFDSQGLSDTGVGKASLSYKVKGGKLMIEGLKRVLLLQYGRRPGTPPPFGVIKEWVIRKLNPPEEAVYIITKTIVDKIAANGTQIFRDEAKGLELELILDDLNKELNEIVLIFEQKRITDGLITTWQS